MSDCTLEFLENKGFKAIRMLGRQPMDAADDHRVLRIYLACDAMSPGERTSLADLQCETTEDEGEEFGRRIAGRGADGSKPADAEAGHGVLSGLVEEAARRLEILLEGHLERRAALAAVRRARQSYDETKEGGLARRYEMDCDRAVQRAANLFFKVRKEIDALQEEGSGPGGGAAVAATDAMSDVGDETNPTAVAPPMDGWSGFTEMDGDETNSTAAVLAPIGAGDETNPTAAAAPLESRLQAASGTGIPSEAATPTGAPLESRLQAESAISSADETKPSSPRSRSVTVSGHEGSRAEAAADPESPSPMEEGPTPPGHAEPSDPDPSHPVPAIVLEALKVLARRRAEATWPSILGDDDLVLPFEAGPARRSSSDH